MKDKGVAHIGIGIGTGDDKCIDAVKQAITSPLLETTIQGASHVIINISGDISLVEANEAATFVQELAGDSANIIFGAMYDDTNPDTATITVIATGLDSKSSREILKTPDFLRRPMASPMKPLAKPEMNLNRGFTSTGSYNGLTTQNTDSNKKPLSQPFGQPTKAPVNTNAETGGIKIPEFLQKNRHNK